MFRTCRLLRQEGLILYLGHYVIIHSFEVATKEWRILTLPQALRLTLRPWKYDFREYMSPRQARQKVQTIVQEPKAHYLPPCKGMCVRRWATPEDRDADGRMDLEKQRKLMDVIEFEYYAYVYD